MKIALDFDETVDLDHDLWSKFIAMAKAHGHIVTIVTFRYPGPHNDDIQAFAKLNAIRIIYCQGQQKASCFDADVWIDDSPSTIPICRGIDNVDEL